MLSELSVTGLGVIDELSILLEGGMTAVTGETGAGKTLIVEAIELLVGGRADPTMVREGAREAVVEGRFVLGDEEIVLRRVVPSQGRSRAYVDGRLATATSLSEAGASLVDLHGQHAHQSLLSVAAQRQALDRFAGADHEPLSSARKNLDAIEARRRDLGGDARERAREVDLLHFQVQEIEAAALSDPDEDASLEAEEDLLAGALSHRELGQSAMALLSVDGGATGLLAETIGMLEGQRPFTDLASQLRAASAEVTDAADQLRRAVESIEEDPNRLEAVRERRQLLHELRRKYGETLVDVMAFGIEARRRFEEIQRQDALAAELERTLVEAQAALTAAAAALGSQRRAAAPGLAAAVKANLAELAMPKAQMVIDVGPDPGDEVVFSLAANVGSSPAPLARVASGGELARTMLALRLVLSEAPPTLVFDEVDAGVGGAAALSVGRSLAQLGGHHQVLVVTHLPQVAGYADHQLVVHKQARRGKTYTGAEMADVDRREVEIARMLSGSPGSSTARGHARELLSDAAGDRARVRDGRA